MVLDGVVGPAGQVLGDLRPPVPQTLVGEEQQPLLLVAPLLLLDIRIQMVVPSLSALLPDSPCVQHPLPGRFSEIVVHF